MPIMDGLTSTMLIRKYEWERGLKRTPIIMQTGTLPLPSHTPPPPRAHRPCDLHMFVQTTR